MSSLSRATVVRLICAATAVVLAAGATVWFTTTVDSVFLDVDLLLGCFAAGALAAFAARQTGFQFAIGGLLILWCFGTVWLEDPGLRAEGGGFLALLWGLGAIAAWVVTAGFLAFVQTRSTRASPS
jgi:hypothetical protein